MVASRARRIKQFTGFTVPELARLQKLSAPCQHPTESELRRDVVELHQSGTMSDRLRRAKSCGQCYVLTNRLLRS